MANRIGLDIRLLLDATAAVKGMKTFDKASRKSLTTEEKRARAQKKATRLTRTRRNELARMAGAMRRTTDALRTMNAMSVLQNATMLTGSLVVAAFAAAFAILIGVLTLAVVAYAKFEKGVTRANAVLQANSTVADIVSTKILTLARTSLSSFEDTAKAFEQLVRTGLSATQAMAALPFAIQLAIAANTGLTESTEIIIRTLFGFGIALKNLKSALESLAFASIKSNVTLQQLGQSMKFIAPVARVAGVAFEEVIAALGLMGNAGIQASLAGTTLRAAIAKLVNPSREGALVMQQLGLDIFVVNGRITSLSDILLQLERKGAGIIEIFTLFGLRAGPGLAALLSIGGNKLKQFTDQIKAADNVLGDLTKRNLNTISAQFSIFSKNMTAVTINFGEVIADMIGLVALIRDVNTILDATIKKQEKLLGPSRRRAELSALKAELGLSDVARGIFGNFNMFATMLRATKIDPQIQRQAQNVMDVMANELQRAGLKSFSEFPIPRQKFFIGRLEHLAELQRIIDKTDEKSLSDEEAAKAAEALALAQELATTIMLASQNPVLQLRKEYAEATAKVKGFQDGFELLEDPLSKVFRKQAELRDLTEKLGEEYEDLMDILGFMPRDLIRVKTLLDQATEARKRFENPEPLPLRALEPVVEALDDFPRLQLAGEGFERFKKLQDEFIRGQAQIMDMIFPDGPPAIPPVMLEIGNLIVETNEFLEEGANQWHSYGEAIFETIAQLVLVREAYDDAGAGQRELLAAQVEQLESNLHQLEVQRQVTNGIMVLSGALGESTRALFAQARAGKFSSSELAKAFRSGIGRELEALAIREMALGFSQLALGFATGGAEHFTASGHHFTSAAIAGSAGLAVSFGAGGPANVAANPLSDDNQESQEQVRATSVTIIFESGSTVVSQSTEEFAREITEQVIKALDDNVA